MKYALIIKRRQQYIAGIFSNNSSAIAFYNLFSLEKKSKTTLKEIDLDYPCYLTEDKRGFIFHSLSSLEAELKQFLHNRKPDNEGAIPTCI